MINTIIKGVGMYLPEKILTNDDISEFVDTSHEWIFDRTGIRQRHIASKDQMTSDLAYMSALDAIQDANINARDIDLIILATSTPDQVFPSTAVKLQDMLNIRDGAAFDIQAVCAGFVYAMTVADNFLRAGQSSRALVIGAETFTRLLDWTDRGTCVLFGDGAGAVVLDSLQIDPKTQQYGVLSTHLHSDGRNRDILYVDGGPSMTSETGHVRMSGKEVFKHAVSKLGSVIKETLVANDLSSDDIDWLVPHQANRRISEAIGKNLELDDSLIHSTVEVYGNTTSATIPIGLDDAVRNGKLKQGMLISNVLGLMSPHAT